MLNKSLIQFFAHVWGFIPSLRGQTIVGVMATFVKRTYASTLQRPGLLYSVPLTIDPHLLVELLLCFLSPGVHKCFVCAL